LATRGRDYPQDDNFNYMLKTSIYLEKFSFLIADENGASYQPLISKANLLLAKENLRAKYVVALIEKGFNEADIKIEESDGLIILKDSSVFLVAKFLAKEPTAEEFTQTKKSLSDKAKFLGAARYGIILPHDEYWFPTP